MPTRRMVVVLAALATAASACSSADAASCPEGRVEADAGASSDAVEVSWADAPVEVRRVAPLDAIGVGAASTSPEGVALVAVEQRDGDAVVHMDDRGTPWRATLEEGVVADVGFDGGTPVALVGAGDGLHRVELDVATGEITDCRRLADRGGVALLGDGVVAQVVDSRLQVLDAADGDELTAADLATEFVDGVAVLDDDAVLVVGAEAGLEVHHLDGGEPATVDIASLAGAEPGRGGEDGGRLVRVWVLEPTVDGGQARALVAAVDETDPGARSTRLSAVDLPSGEVVWQEDHDGTVGVAPAGGGLVAVTTAGETRVLEPTAGEVVHRTTEWAAPEVSDDGLLLHVASGGERHAVTGSDETVVVVGEGRVIGRVRVSYAPGALEAEVNGHTLVISSASVRGGAAMWAVPLEDLAG